MNRWWLEGDVAMQFSLFGAAVAAPARDDLAGVLLGGGHWVRSGGTARLSVVVDAPWRAQALARELAERDLRDGEAVVLAEGGFGVRTCFTAELLPMAAAWRRGANELPPAQFVLTAGGLRLWAIVAGHRDEVGYRLGTAEPADPMHHRAGAQLSRLGVAAVSVTQRGRPGWRVTSAKRLRRLHELVGMAPEGVGDDWPTVR